MPPKCAVTVKATVSCKKKGECPLTANRKKTIKKEETITKWVAINETTKKTSPPYSTKLECNRFADDVRLLSNDMITVHEFEVNDDAEEYISNIGKEKANVKIEDSSNRHGYPIRKIVNPYKKVQPRNIQKSTPTKNTPVPGKITSVAA